MSQTRPLKTVELIERWATLHPEYDEWVCRIRRGLDWPGAWNADLGPQPDDWVKPNCGRDGCGWCA